MFNGCEAWMIREAMKKAARSGRNVVFTEDDEDLLDEEGHE